MIRPIVVSMALIASPYIFWWLFSVTDTATPPTSHAQELSEMKLAEQEIEGQEHIKSKRVEFMLKCQDMRSKFLYGE